jgi:hypothetical protein
LYETNYPAYGPVEEKTFKRLFDFFNRYSCEIVALRENVDRLESYDSVSAKSCVFFAHDLGYISSFPYIICPKARYKKVLCHLSTTLVPSLPHKV